MRKLLLIPLIGLILVGCGGTPRRNVVSLPTNEVITPLTQGQPAPYAGVLMPTGTYQSCMEKLDGAN